MAALAGLRVNPGRIAAIITCHNLGRTLGEAVESVERQIRPAAEIVVVDDGSTDIYTRQALSRLEREGTSVVRIAAGSASAARNYGARLTSAEYLLWLDADDTLEPQYFGAAAGRLDADPDLDFVSCAMRAFGEATYIWTPAPPTFVDAIATGGVPHASTMIRRRLWNAVGGFDETLRSFELLDFWAAALDRPCRGIVLDEPLLNYRVRAGSGYRRSIQTDTYLARLRHLYAKHHDAIARHALELIQRKEAFLLGQRDHQQSLETRIATLEAERDDLGRRIDGVTRVLAARGQSRVDWGDLRRPRPLSPVWGRDRGTPIDRYYIEQFLDIHRGDVHGRVLEVRDSAYTRRFGLSTVTSSEVVDIDPANTRATVIADLRHAESIATGSYDCIILTQTLHLVDDMRSVIAECARILRLGGVLLMTAPSIIRVDDEAGPDGDYWRLTEASARTLLAEVFAIDAFELTAYGNVAACAAFLYGISVEEMEPADLDPVDSRFPLVIAARAVRTGAPAIRRSASHRAVILAYHRVAELTPDTHRLCTPPAMFQQQMGCLSREFQPIDLEHLVHAAASGRIPERSVAITLDDGYLDALTIASPILASFGIPATFFVNSDRLDDPHERWWDTFEGLFLSDITLPPELDVEVSGQRLRVPTASSSERGDALERIHQTAWALDAISRRALLENVLAWSGATVSVRSTHRVLTGGEVRDLASRPGHAIGAHTVHHLALTTQPVETKRREVVDDQSALARLLGRPVPLFSYPYGEVDAELLAVVRESGFLAAVTIQAGVVAAGTNRLLLPRVEMAANGDDRFLDRLKDLFQ